MPAPLRLPGSDKTSELLLYPLSAAAEEPGVVEGGTYKFHIVGAGEPRALEPSEQFEIDPDDRTMGRFRPENHVGIITVVAELDDGAEVRFDVDVRSAKISYDSEYRSLLEQVADHAAEAVLQGFAPSSRIVASSTEKVGTRIPFPRVHRRKATRRQFPGGWIRSSGDLTVAGTQSTSRCRSPRSAWGSSSARQLTRSRSRTVGLPTACATFRSKRCHVPWIRAATRSPSTPTLIASFGLSFDIGRGLPPTSNGACRRRPPSAQAPGVADSPRPAGSSTNATGCSRPVRCGR